MGPEGRAAILEAVRWTMAIALAGCLGPAAAAAQDEPADDPQAEALRLFEESKVAYREGRFDDAVSLLTEAHQLFPEPVLLYNLGRALEGAGEYARAVEAYDEYLEIAGDIPDRGAIEGRVVTLRREIATRARLERLESTRRPPRPPPRERERASAVPWIVAAVGGAGIAVGGVFGVLALSSHDDAESAPSQAETETLQADAEDRALIANVAFAAGGAVLAIGVVWGLVDVLTLDSESIAVAIGPSSIAFEARLP
jgi:tetratricopeptide (TPR) repeat protein